MDCGYLFEYQVHVMESLPSTNLKFMHEQAGVKIHLSAFEPRLRLAKFPSTNENNLLCFVILHKAKYHKAK
jgi:hypothetical protein